MKIVKIGMTSIYASITMKWTTLRRKAPQALVTTAAAGQFCSLTHVALLEVLGSRGDRHEQTTGANNRQTREQHKRQTLAEIHIQAVHEVDNHGTNHA